MRDENTIPERPSTQPAAEPPVQERHQPDPMLQMSTGRAGGIGFAIIAVAVVVILGVVFYGLNRQPGSEHTAAGPAANHSSQPTAGGQAGPPAPTGQQTTPNG